MARQYSLRTFIRNIPNDLLKRYFVAKGFKRLKLDWSEIGKKDPEPVFEAIAKLTENQRAEVESDFTMINELAEAKGTRAILEEAEATGQKWAKQFAKMENDYARAFWTFLNHRAHFDAAGAFHQMDRYGGWWRRFVGKRLDVATEGKPFNAFKAGLRKFYWAQGCGRFCEADYYHRANPSRHLFFAYPEDLATSDMIYDETGKLARKPRRSAFEAIFVYRVEEGDLELHVRGADKDKEELARIFCKTILGLSGLPDDSGRTPYDLRCLKDANYPFTTDPKDAVLGVELKLLRLDLPGDRPKGLGRRIQFSATTTATAPKAVHQLIADSIDSAKLPLKEVQVGHARMTIIFQSFEGRRQTKRLTFDIKYPDYCSLKDDPYDQIAKKYLKRWGIARD